MAPVDISTIFDSEITEILKLLQRVDAVPLKRSSHEAIGGLRVNNQWPEDAAKRW